MEAGSAASGNGFPSPDEAGSAWRPTALRDALHARASLLTRIRDYFGSQGVMEVETPLVTSGAAPDLHLHSFTVCDSRGESFAPPRYLVTSPEFHMKRLLAAGSGSIFQICRVFRDGEAGRLHNPEFTMLEWYRRDYDHHALMDDVDGLLRQVGIVEPSDRQPYGAAFENVTGVDPHRATVAQLRQTAKRLGIGAPKLDSRDQWLDLIASHSVIPALGHGRPLYLYDFPESQAALARIRKGTPPVAERFELFLNGVELANGYHELTDPVEQRRRFAENRLARRNAGLADIAPDERFLQALHRLPPCAGVAVGLDRLLMSLLGVDRIDQIIPFPWDMA